MTANIRQKQQGESMAGSLLPLIDQMVSGAISGTFDTKIVDNFVSDEQEFKDTFPALKDIEIKLSIIIIIQILIVFYLKYAKPKHHHLNLLCISILTTFCRYWCCNSTCF
jgi:hypothetical protein